jgi:hypothetical protein
MTPGWNRSPVSPECDLYLASKLADELRVDLDIMPKLTKLTLAISNDDARQAINAVGSLEMLRASAKITENIRSLVLVFEQHPNLINSTEAGDDRVPQALAWLIPYLGMHGVSIEVL